VIGPPVCKLCFNQACDLNTIDKNASAVNPVDSCYKIKKRGLA